MCVKEGLNHQSPIGPGSWQVVRLLRGMHFKEEASPSLDAHDFISMSRKWGYLVYQAPHTEIIVVVIYCGGLKSDPAKMPVQ